MKPVAFEYEAPDSLEAVLALIGEHGYDAKMLAGGQSLVPAMNFRLAQPAMLVDLNRIEGLDYVRRGEDGLEIGTMTRQRRVEQDALVSEDAPLLYEVMPHIAHPQIRNRGTLGGSLAHADPAAELPVVALALGMRLRVRSAGGERLIEADDFFQGIFATALEPDEMLVEVIVPPMEPHSGWSFMEVARRHGDYAMAGMSVVVTLDTNGVCSAARLVYLNAGDRPVVTERAAELLIGERRSDEVIKSTVNMATENEIEPLGSVHASVDYQRHVAGVLTRRALEQAFERAEGGLG